MTRRPGKDDQAAAEGCLENCGHTFKVTQVNMYVLFPLNQHKVNGKLDSTLVVVLPR